MKKKLKEQIELMFKIKWLNLITKIKKIKLNLNNNLEKNIYQRNTTNNWEKNTTNNWFLTCHSFSVRRDEDIYLFVLDWEDYLFPENP